MNSVIKKIAMGAIFVWPLLGWTIGRAGNGTKDIIFDSVLGFETATAEGFVMTTRYADGSLRVSQMTVDSRGPVENFLQFVALEDFFPELSNMNREESRAQSLELGGRQIPHLDPCVDAYIYHSESLIYATAIWGQSKGVAVIAPRSDRNVRSVLESIMKLKLDAGACAWN